MSQRCTVLKCYPTYRSWLAFVMNLPFTRITIPCIHFVDSTFVSHLMISYTIFGLECIATKPCSWCCFISKDEKGKTDHKHISFGYTLTWYVTKNIRYILHKYRNWCMPSKLYQLFVRAQQSSLVPQTQDMMTLSPKGRCC